MNRHLACTGGHVFIGWITFDNRRAFFTGIVQISLKPFILAIVNNAGEIIIIFQRWVHLCKIVLETVHKSVNTMLWAQHIVWCNTGLAGIERFAKCNGLSCIIHINMI